MFILAASMRPYISASFQAKKAIGQNAEERMQPERARPGMS